MCLLTLGGTIMPSKEVSTLTPKLVNVTWQNRFCRCNYDYYSAGFEMSILDYPGGLNLIT